jgi:cytosine/adenosine deaminase-related metal-dependent hydrolase
MAAPGASPPAAPLADTGGLVNAHTHLYSALAPFGMPAPQPAPQSFVEILERVWWRLDRALDARAIAAGARLYAAEALLAGTTVLVDHHESPHLVAGSLDLLADACEEIGIRALLCFGATERNRGGEEAARGLAECRRFVRANRRPLVRGCVGLHASFTVSDETLRAAGNLARELGTIVHVHLAEDAADVVDARRRGWPGPLERMLGLDALPAGSILAHGVHLGEAEVRQASDAGCWLVQNPRSNRGNRVGYPLALAASPRVALGTDGYPADLGAELAALAEVGLAEGEAPAALAARLQGSQALGVALFGEGAAARPGAPASSSPSTGRGVGTTGTDPPGPDVPAALPAAAAPTAAASPPRQRPTPSVATETDALATTAAWVARVQRERQARTVVGGRLVVDRGQLLTADLAALRTAAAVEAARLWRRL